MQSIVLPLNTVAATPLRAIPVTLAWDSGPDPSVAGYAVYCGPSNLPLTNRVNVGTARTVTLSNLLANVNYTFYAVSYNDDNVESPPSNLLQFTPRALSHLKISREASGRMRISLKAVPGAVCRVEYADAPSGATWKTLTNVTAGALGEVAATDMATTLRPARFYRAALVSSPVANGRLHIFRQPTGVMSLTLAASAGTTWRIQYASSPSATSWRTLTIVTANAVGEAIVTDNTAAQVAARFYRALMQ